MLLKNLGLCYLALGITRAQLLTSGEKLDSNATPTAQGEKLQTAPGGMEQEQGRYVGTGEMQPAPPGDVKLSASEGVYNL